MKIFLTLFCLLVSVGFTYVGCVEASQSGFPSWAIVVFVLAILWAWLGREIYAGRLP